MRPRLCVHRRRRWPGGVHHPDRRIHRRVLRADRRGDVSAAVLVARRAVGAIGSRDDAGAAALHEVALDRAAVSPQGSGGPPDRSGQLMSQPLSGRALIVPVLTTTVIVVALLSLGVWQLERRVDKLALIAALDERLAATPAPLPPPADWVGLS